MKEENAILKPLLDFLPIILFFVAYNLKIENIQPIMLASAVGGIATVLVLIISKLKNIKLEKLALYSNIAFILFSALTVIFNNPNFIKAKLTILNGILACLLFYFYLRKKPALKSLFRNKIYLEDEKWNILNLRFSLMFFLISLMNTYFWQFKSEQAWVNFKTFGVLPFIFIYFVIQFKFIVKHGTVLNK